MRRERGNGRDSPAALGVAFATCMRPCQRGWHGRRAAGGRGRGATGDDQGPATTRQQGPGRTDADITARGGQGSGGCATGDPTARPGGPPPTVPASCPGRETLCPPLVPCDAVAGGRGPGWADGPGRTEPRSQDREFRRPGVWQRYV